MARGKRGTLQLRMTGRESREGEGWGLHAAVRMSRHDRKSQYHQVRPPVIVEVQLRAIKTPA